MAAVAEGIGVKKLFIGVVVMGATFAALGTVAALWENPVFIRMIPADGWEISLLAILSVLSGVYVAIRRPFCSDNTLSAGGVVSFIGLACPICNKILLLAFGSELLMAYFDPMRVYVTAFGILVTAWAVIREWQQRMQIETLPETSV